MFQKFNPLQNRFGCGLAENSVNLFRESNRFGGGNAGPVDEVAGLNQSNVGVAIADKVKNTQKPKTLVIAMMSNSVDVEDYNDLVPHALDFIENIKCISMSADPMLIYPRYAK